jgi:hypothetical protein
MALTRYTRGKEVLDLMFALMGGKRNGDEEEGEMWTKMEGGREGIEWRGEKEKRKHTQ